MNDNIYYTIGALIAVFMAVIGIYSVGQDDLKHGFVVFGLGLYLLNLLAISRIQKQINGFEGGEE